MIWQIVRTAAHYEWKAKSSAAPGARVEWGRAASYASALLALWDFENPPPVNPPESEVSLPILEEIDQYARWTERRNRVKERLGL